MFDWLKHLFGGGDQSAALALLQKQQAEAEKSASEARDAQLEAIKQAQEAAKPPVDNEAARQSAEERMRQLLAARGAGSTFMGGAGAGPVPVATRVLFGQ